MSARRKQAPEPFVKLARPAEVLVDVRMEDEIPRTFQPVDVPGDDLVGRLAQVGEVGCRDVLRGEVDVAARTLFPEEFAEHRMARADFQHAAGMRRARLRQPQDLTPEHGVLRRIVEGIVAGEGVVELDEARFEPRHGRGLVFVDQVHQVPEQSRDGARRQSSDACFCQSRSNCSSSSRGASPGLAMCRTRLGSSMSMPSSLPKRWHVIGENPS